jgi:hypothetical protein
MTSIVKEKKKVDGLKDNPYVKEKRAYAKEKSRGTKRLLMRSLSKKYDWIKLKCNYNKKEESSQ